MCGTIERYVDVAPIHAPLMRAKAKRGIYERAGGMKLKAGDGPADVSLKPSTTDRLLYVASEFVLETGFWQGDQRPQLYEARTERVHEGFHPF